MLIIYILRLSAFLRYTDIARVSPLLLGIGFLARCHFFFAIRHAIFDA